MSFKIYKVNATGLQTIKQFMLENHKRPDEATTDAALAAWAMDAEVYADVNDGEVIVELPAADSVHGTDAALVLDEQCVDVDIFSEEC